MGWRIPMQVAVTTALAAGGLQPVGGLPPVPANASTQDVITGAPVALGAGASATVSLPVVPAGQRGSVYQLAFLNSDPANVTMQTLINGIGANPYPVAHVGQLGASLAVPYTLVVAVALIAGQTFGILVNNPTGVGVTFQVRIIGAFFA